MDKYIKENHVAVLYSPGYGSGWYTSNTEYPEILFDPTIVDMLLGGELTLEEIGNYAKLKYPDIYLGGIDTLCIFWVKIGEKFIVHEYDGHEEVWISSKIDWFET